MTAVHGLLIPVGGGESISLTRPQMTVGRRDSCDICLRFPNVSGQHCQLNFRDGYWYLQDLNSTNGLKINGTRVNAKNPPGKALRPGDELAIATHKFTIRYTVAPDAELIDEVEDFSRSLLEKAGLTRQRSAEDRPRPKPQPRPAPVEDDEDDSDE